MSIEQIEKARKKLLSNSELLFKESKILFKHKHYARSYTLAHLCGEELAKISMLISAGLSIVKGKNVDWKNLDNRMKSHKDKLEATQMHDYMRSNNKTANFSDLISYEELQKNTADLNRIKNSSLYCEQTGGDFVEPSDQFDQKKAMAEITMTEERLKYMRQSKDIPLIRKAQ